MTSRTIVRERWLAALLLPVLIATFLHAQQEKSAAAKDAAKDEDAPAFKQQKSAAETVSLPILLRAKSGKLPAVAAADLTLNQDGKPAGITALAPNHEPLRACILVDTSAFLKDHMKAVKGALHGFVATALVNPDDKLCLLHFDREVELLMNFTGSKDRLGRAIDELDAAPMNPDKNQAGHADAAQHDDDKEDAEIRRPRRPTKTLNDGLYLAADELLSKQQGRKALILVTDGIDFSSKETLVDAIETLQRSQIFLYALYTKGDYSGWGRGEQGHGGRQPGGNGGGNSGSRPTGTGGWPGGGGWPGSGGGGNQGGGGRGNGQDRPADLGQLPDGLAYLQKLTDKTGGRVLEEKHQDFEALLNSVAEDLRSQYVVSFTPNAGHGQYRHIEILAKDKNVDVYGPEGYYEH